MCPSYDNQHRLFYIVHHLTVLVYSYFADLEAHAVPPTSTIHIPTLDEHNIIRPHRSDYDYHHHDDRRRPTSTDDHLTTTFLSSTLFCLCQSVLSVRPLSSLRVCVHAQNMDCHVWSHLCYFGHVCLSQSSQPDISDNEVRRIRKRRIPQHQRLQRQTPSACSWQRRGAYPSFKKGRRRVRSTTSGLLVLQQQTLSN